MSRASRRGAAVRLGFATGSVALGLLATTVAPARRSATAGSSPLSPRGARLELGSGPDLSQFQRVREPRAFTLPIDHGPHFAFQTEWWYFTGNLAASDGRRFGFQLTFFRRGLSPGPPPGGPGLSSNQVYFAHFAITDVAAGRHRAVERFSRGAASLAGATGGPFAVWLEDWRVEARSADGGLAGARPTSEPAWRLTARDAASGLRLDLEMHAEKPLVAHGERGVSPKSEEPGNASYYVGYTRLRATGRLAQGPEAAGITGEGSAPPRAAGQPAAAQGPEAAGVTGEAWFDHEWSTSALGKGAVGWDWFSLQLDDGRELMLFRIRREDGSIERASSGTLVETDGRARRLAREQAQVDVLARWSSPHSGARYPASWRIVVPLEGLDLRIVPLLADQEMQTSFLYWEGAVEVSGTSRGQPVSGHGYVELTGYARSMQAVF